MRDHIVIKGARENNLKNIDVEIPRDALVVMTGLSGSGKSSLAFDTIFAEGQRRYMESLSSYARQFLGQMDKPDVDSIEGMSPAISIDQKTTSKNPRSTVGTVTEIYDYLRLLIAALKVADDALKRAAQHAGTAVGIIMQGELFIPRAVEQDLAHVLRQVADGRCKVKVIFFRQCVVIHPADALIFDAVPAARGDAAVEDGLRRVRNDERRVDAQPRAEAAAGRTRAVGAVEREHPRRELLDRDAAVVAGVVLREEELALFLRDVCQHETTGERGRDLHGVGQAAVLIRADDDAVDHDLDIVLAVFIERDRLRKVIDAAVHAHAHIPAAAGIVEHLLVLALTCTDDRRQDLHARRLRQRRDLIDDLVDRLAADLLAALRAVRRAAARPQKAQIVIDLRDRANGRAGIAAGGLLVDGDGGGKAVDGVNVRLVHLAEEHARVGAEALHVAALAFGIYGIEREAGFSAAGEAGYHDQLVSRYLNVDIFQIVFSCAFYINTVQHLSLIHI